MDIIVLAGGFGTRLKNLVSEVPKPMAPINNKPFLEYLLEYLLKFDPGNIILSVGYKHELISSYFGNSYKNKNIIYSVENFPLGTGGAIKKAINKCKDSNIIVINGDSLFDINLGIIYNNHIKSNADLTMATKTINNTGRYGTVITNQENRIVGFSEKTLSSKGNINCGVYVFKRSIFDSINTNNNFSFEHDLLAKYYSKFVFKTAKYDGYFIDIGVPEDYITAQKVVPQIFGRL